MLKVIKLPDYDGSLPGKKAIKPLIGVVNLLLELLNISIHLSCSRRNAATSLLKKRVHQSTLNLIRIEIGQVG